MPRQPRIVMPGQTHHITQRGNYRQNIFEKPKDFKWYIHWLKEYSEKYNIDILSY